MEWCIPIQTFQVEHVQIGSMPIVNKPIISLGYKDNDMTFTSLSILLPSLTIKSYTPASGKLVISLEDSPQTLRKLLMLQDTVLSSVCSNQQRWFPQQPFIRRLSEIKGSFQPIISDTEMTLYCPINNTDIQGPNMYTEEKWLKGIQESGLLLPGTKIRVVLRLQGISFHISPHTEQWSGKFRLQHRLLAILIPPISQISQ